MPRKANTRAASGAGSIRQRPDGRWEARVTVGNDPGTGKPIRRSIYGETQAAVRKQMTAILREIDRGTYLTPQKRQSRNGLTNGSIPLPPIRSNRQHTSTIRLV